MGASTHAACRGAAQVCLEVAPDGCATDASLSRGVYGRNRSEGGLLGKVKCLRSRGFERLYWAQRLVLGGAGRLDWEALA